MITPMNVTPNPPEPSGPPKLGGKKDAPGFDLYAELFAAFFPVPVPAALAADTPGGQLGDGAPGADAAEAADETHLLPTGDSIAADAKEFFDGRFGPQAPQLVFDGNSPGAHRIGDDPPIEEKLGGPTDRPDPLFEPVVPNVKQDPATIGRDPDSAGATCGMPARKDRTVASFITPLSSILPDASEAEDYEGLLELTGQEQTDHGSVEIEVLEIPTAPLHPRHEKTEQSDQILDLPPAPATDRGLAAGAANTHVVSAIPAAVHHRRHLSDFAGSPHNERIDINVKGAPPNTNGRTLLEVFTEKFSDARGSQALRALTKDAAEVEAGTPGFADALTEKQNVDGDAQFGFDTSVGGETQFVKPEKPEISDAKMRRIVFDQVGSHLNDLAAKQGPGDDKRVLMIKLSPAELGSVEITLSKSAEGVIDAHFRTDNAHAQRAIEETLAQLRDSLERSGMQVGNLNTSCSSYSNQHGGSTERETKRGRAIPTAPSAIVKTGESVSKSKSNADRLVSLRA